MKICSCCQTPKAEEFFYRKRAVFESICKECKREKSNRPDLVLKRKQRQKSYRINNRERESARVSKWNINNRVRYRTRINLWLREKRKADMGFRLRMNLSSQLSHFVTGTARRAIKLLLGCSLQELKIHLQTQFVPGMTWENYGPVWHVDHIKPCAKFDLTDPEQQKQCFHHTNLQPLFALDNIKKSDLYPA